LYAHWTDHLFGRSNIYFQPDAGETEIGSLTFSEDDSSQKGYQGLYFKWGSLIGVAAYPSGSYDYTGSHDDDTFLYIPSISTGKYYKVRAGLVFAGYSGSTDEMTEAVQKYAAKVSDNSWDKIPFVDGGTGDGQIDATGAGRSDKRLTERSTATETGLYRYYMGDICKFLSDKKDTNDSGLTRSWVMPKSEIWKGGQYGQDYDEDIDGVYRYEKNSGWGGSGSFSPSDENGTGSTENAFITYFNNVTKEEVIFPAAGNRDGVMLLDVGVSGGYWGSSVYDASTAYGLGFGSSYLYPGGISYRTYGFPVRCVQEL
jgi:hypothetical protein